MGLTETEITLIVVGSCGGVLLAVFISCLIIFCCFRRGNKHTKLQQPSYRSTSGFRQGGIRDYRYERTTRPPPPPPYTQSTSVHSEFDKRSIGSDRIYSTAYEGRKIPLRPIDYDRMRDDRRRSSGFYPPLERSFGLYPPVDFRRKDDTPSINLKENTVFIPYAPRFSNAIITEKVYTEQFYPRLSIKEIDDNDSNMEEIEYKSREPKLGLPRYELDYL